MEKRKGPPIKPDPNEEYKPVTVGVLNESAIALAKVNDQYAIVKIKFNAITGDVGTPEVTLKDSSLASAEYDFRDLVEQYLDEIGNK